MLVGTECQAPAALSTEQNFISYSGGGWVGVSSCLDEL